LVPIFQFGPVHASLKISFVGSHGLTVLNGFGARLWSVLLPAWLAWWWDGQLASCALPRLDLN